MAGNDTGLHRFGHHDDAPIAPDRHFAMHYPAVIASIDAMFNVTGLLIRAGLYSALGHLASQNEVAATLLAGIFVGDALASVIHIFWDPAGHTAATVAELVLLLVLFWWLGSNMTWPTVFGAASLPFWVVAGGVTALRLRRGMLKPVGPNDFGWS
jgi:hypothetical protein